MPIVAVCVVLCSNCFSLVCVLCLCSDGSRSIHHGALLLELRRHRLLHTVQHGAGSHFHRVRRRIRRDETRAEEGEGGRGENCRYPEERLLEVVARSERSREYMYEPQRHVMTQYGGSCVCVCVCVEEML